jgi:hypothetical protein
MDESGDAFFNSPSFTYLMEQCQIRKALTLERIALDEEHCRVFGDFSKPGLEIELRYCRITGVQPQYRLRSLEVDLAIAGGFRENNVKWSC